MSLDRRSCHITVPAGTSKSAEIATAMNTALAMLSEKMVAALGG
jgi:hypothetical protein